MKSETRQRLAHFINHPITDISVMVLILASIVLLILELAATDPVAQLRLRYINAGFTCLFVIELGLRYLAETRKRRFFRGYWIDILAVMPFLRLLRVLRVFRLLSVFRFGLALSRRMGWINHSLQREAVQWFGVAVFIAVVVLFGAVGLNLAETDASIGDTMWWSIFSLIAGEPIGTVPQTALGRMVAIGVMLSGLIVFAMLTGVVSAMMIQRLAYIDRDLMDVDELENHIIICGWNRSGLNILTELQEDPDHCQRGIVIIGEFQEAPEWPPSVRFPHLIFIIKGDFTRLEMLERAGLQRAGQAIVLADRLVERSDQDRDARTVLAAMLIERIKPEIFTSVELLNRDNATFLKSMGVDEIVVGTEYAGSIIATSTRNHGIVKVFDELLTSRYGNQLYKVAVPPRLVGHPYGELVGALKDEHDALLIGLEWPPGVPDAPARGMDVNPPAGRVVLEGARLIVIARERPRW